MMIFDAAPDGTLRPAEPTMFSRVRLPALTMGCPCQHGSSRSRSMLGWTGDVQLQLRVVGAADDTGRVPCELLIVHDGALVAKRRLRLPREVAEAWPSESAAVWLLDAMARRQGRSARGARGRRVRRRGSVELQEGMAGRKRRRRRRRKRRRQRMQRAGERVRGVVETGRAVADFASDVVGGRGGNGPVDEEYYEDFAPVPAEPQRPAWLLPAVLVGGAALLAVGT